MQFKSNVNLCSDCQFENEGYCMFHGIMFPNYVTGRMSSKSSLPECESLRKFGMDCENFSRISKSDPQYKIENAKDIERYWKSIHNTVAWLR